MASIVAVVSACVAAACALVAWRARVDEQRRSDARVAALAAALDPARGHDAPIFDQPASQRAHSLVTLTAGLAAVVAIVFVVVMVSVARALHSTDVVASADRDRSDIALVAMTHAREGDTFVIHGLVRNQGAGRMSGLVAVVAVLDAAGHTVASGRAPLDDQRLPPGESSRFEVRLDGIRTVERYRVSFVGPDGGIVRHLDVRGRVAAPSRTPGPARPASAGF